MMRFGILGAARVAPMALLEPASRRSDVEIVAIAAKRPGAAKEFASAWNIATAYDSYDDLVNDLAVDVVYNALPPHLHAEFSIKALEAGKHVLCEKPFAMNLREAQRMQEAAILNGRRIVEAFHDRYHPVFAYLRKVTQEGRCGKIQSLSATFNHSIPEDPREFRRVAAMGGGALMDLGCYPVHWCRSLLGEEPEITRAEALLSSDGYDEEIRATLRFRSGVEATIEALMTPGWTYYARFTIVGDRGTIVAENSLLPHRGHSIIENIDGVFRQHTIAGNTTFDHQLDAFLNALASGEILPTEGPDPIGNMGTIDAIYAQAGVKKNGEL
ncbi:hypothetical protein N182_30015 [Sinorhizobium sp. GL2]|nr:hypothetical protein N182_30015 [Sinorhizobium sp. GL2]